jgi:hypothetical protein
MLPDTFLSVVQKIGRCVRNMSELGEAIIYITHSALRQANVELAVTGNASDTEDDNDEEVEVDTEDVVEEPPPIDRVAAIDVGDEDDGQESVQKQPKRGTRRKTKSRNALQQQDHIHLLRFVATERCRWIPWNEFFDNNNKRPVLFSRPNGGRCCDNCQPEDFPVDTIEMEGARVRVSKRGQLSSPELQLAVIKRLKELRRGIVKREYGAGSAFITGKSILSDDVISSLAKYARLYSSTEKIRAHTSWHWVDHYGEEVSSAIGALLPLYPDPVQEARDAQKKEQVFRQIQAMARKDFLERFRKLADECEATILALTRVTKTGTVLKRSTMFMRRPNKKVSEPLMYWVCTVTYLTSEIPRLFGAH